MLAIIWKPSAKDDLVEIFTFIANSNPLAARRLKLLLEASVLPLAEHPYLHPQSN